MSNRFLNYTLTLKTIGPLHIGDGGLIGKNEYVVYGGKLYVFDMKKMFAGLTKFHLEKKYTNSVLSDGTFSLSYFFRENNVSPDKYSKWAKYTLDIPRDVDMRRTNIYSVIKDPYSCPYIPGSSLKGAIRNTILNAVLLNEKNSDFDKDIEKNIHIHKDRNGKPVSKTKYLQKDSEKLDVSLFNTLNRPETRTDNAVNSIFQGLKISDSQPLDTSCLILCPKIDVFPGNNGENKLNNVVRECIKPGTEITFSVQIDTAVFPYDFSRIMECIDKTYSNISMKFLSSFPKATTTADKHKIYIGGNVGYVSKTCVYSLFEERNRAVKNAGEILDHVDSYKPRSRQKMGNHLKDFEEYGVAPHVRKCTKINNKLYDFGLCKIEVEKIQEGI